MTGAATLRQIAITFTLNENFVGYIADRLAQKGVVSRYSQAQREYLVDREIRQLL
jgi:hypothetical protein